MLRRYWHCSSGSDCLPHSNTDLDLGMNQGEGEEEEEGQVQLGGDLAGRLVGGDLAGHLDGDLAGRLGADPHQQDPNHRSKTGVEGLSTGCF